MDINRVIPVERLLQTKFHLIVQGGDTKKMNEKVEEVGVLRPEVQGMEHRGGAREH